MFSPFDFSNIQGYLNDIPKKKKNLPKFTRKDAIYADYYWVEFELFLLEMERLVRELRDAFAWSYDESKVYDRSIIEHAIPLKEKVHDCIGKILEM